MASQDILLKTTLPGCKLVQASSFAHRDLARSVVGLELGASAIKAVAVRRSGDRWRVVWWGIAELDPGLADKRRHEVAVAVLRRWRSLRGFPRKVVVLAPASHRFMAVVLPRMPAKELRRAALWEARSQLYFEEDVVLNACPLSDSATEEKVIVAVSGMRQGLCRDTYRKLQMARISAKRALPAAVAFNYLAEELLPDVQADRFLDLGFGAAKVVALVSGNPMFYRELPKVGENMVRAIAEQADLNPRLAERVFRRCQFVRDPGEEDPDLAYWGDPGSVQQMIFSEVSALANEVEMSVHYLRAHYPSEAETIYCTGGLAEIPGLLNYLSEKVGTKFELLPFPEERLEFARPEVGLTYKRNWGRLVTATGAAVWGLHSDRPKLVGIPLKPRRKPLLGRVNVKLVASLVLTVLVAFANLALMPRLRSLQSELLAQQQVLEELQERIEKARQPSETIDDPVARLDRLRKMAPGWDELLAALATASSDRIWLEELGGTSQALGFADEMGTSEEGIVGEENDEVAQPAILTMEVSGVAASQKDAELFAQRLQATGLFSEVHLGSVEREEDNSRQVRFTLSLGVGAVPEAGRAP